ncbi:MAG TPA: hypothetical protein PKM21_17745 [Anaerolineales bacterium]|nr:hypothetical protein [Anaerolineales bacterium]
MKSKTVQFFRSMILSALFVVSTFSLIGVESHPDSGWTAIHVVTGSLLVLGSAVHLMSNRAWVKAVNRRPVGSLSRGVRRLWHTNLGLLIAGAICALTGVLWLVSPALQLNRLHTLSGLLMIVLLFIHLILHFRWLVNTIRQLTGGRVQEHGTPQTQI